MSGAEAEVILGFAGYRLDARRRRLLGPDGLPVSVSSRAFDTLYYLASHAHELVEKHRLMQAVWPNSVVEENNLNQQISALRKIFGETASDHRFIVTEAGRGYRFVQNVHVIRQPAAVGLTTDEISDAAPASAAQRAPRLQRASVLEHAGAIAAVALLIVGAAGLMHAPRVASNAGGTRNVQAYEAYLAARVITNNVGSTRAREAISLLERAVQLDPNFALAWASLAEAYTFATDFPPSLALPLTPVELQQHIARAALRALELAPDAPQVLRSAGMVSMQNRDWAEAERRLHRAVELAGPYDYDTNLLYAMFLMNVGRVTDAIPYEERAMRAEPLLLRPVTLRAALHEMRGELDQADALLLASTNLRGQESLRRQGLIMVRLARHDRSGALQLGDRTPCSSLEDPQRALADMRKTYDVAIRGGAHGQLMPTAIYASFLGDQTLALQALRALGPSTQSLFSIWRPALSEVRELPGFVDVVREAGLTDYWRKSGEWGEFCRETAGGGVACR